MKKIWKRAVAALCAVTMLAGLSITEFAPTKTVEAAVNSETSYNIMTSADGENIVSDKSKAFYQKNNANIDLPADLQSKAELELYVKIWLEDQTAVDVIKAAYMELANDVCDVQELYWWLGNYTFNVGMNELRFDLPSGNNYPGAGGVSFDPSQTINWFRIHMGTTDNTTTANYIKLYEVTLRENPDTAGLAFGENDTYLQLSNPLASTPEGVEVSIKNAGNSDAEKTTTEWIVRSGRNPNWGGWGAGIQTQHLTYGTASYSDDDLTDDVMEVGTDYVKISLNPYVDSTSTKPYSFNFANTDVAVSIPSEYNMSELSLSFWFYSSTGVWPGGSMRISSNGGTSSGSTNNLAISLANYGTNIKANKWNKITIPLKDFTENGINYQGINYIVWWNQQNVTEATTVGLSDIKIVVNSEWTLAAAGTTMEEMVEKVGYTQSVTKGTVLSDEVIEGLSEGTTYSQVVVPAKDDLNPTGGKLGFQTVNYAGITAPVIPLMYDEDDLAIAFYLYSSTGEALPGGGIGLCSGGWNGNHERRWSDDLISPQIKQIGWNYIEIKLNQGVDFETTEPFDYKNINFARWWTDHEYLTTETTFRFTDIKLIIHDEATPKASVTTAEITDPTTIANKSMIFSNTNVSGETPYAMYVTDKGYPALLWGTTEYTLNYNVCTGDWTNIKAVRNADNYIEFYIDGELKGTSTSVAENLTGAFTTAHCIAADGVGGQLFGGSIMNLRVYSDKNCATPLGSWNLRGDTQYVLEQQQDSSVNANHAVYRGTRANDWVSYESVKAQAIDYVGENYWSMVFIPDIQNLAQTSHGYDKTWYQMADWIAANVETEKIQHVIGAGDNTWSNIESEYSIAQTGFDKFKDLVSWSNMSGNHEFTWTANNRKSTLYNTYFGEEYIQNSASKDTYVGYYNDPTGYSTTENSYYRFNVNGVNWMILQLEYYPRLSVIDWAKGIAEEYASDNIILTTHGYLSGNPSSAIWPYVTETGDYLAVGDGEDYLGATSQEIWNQLSECTNIKMILSGHATTGTGSIVWHNETNSVGDTVPALMINAQDLDLESNGDGSHYFTDQPLGMLSILRFSEDGSKATVQLYCPKYNMSFDPVNPVNPRQADGRDSNNIQLSFNHEAIVKEYTTFAAGIAPTTGVPNGYIFAGWFTDNACTQSLRAESDVSKAYAKFVDEKILTAKAQVSVLGAGEEDSERDIRFVTTVDSLNYQAVGFKFLINNTLSDKSSKTVYKRIYAVGQTSGEPQEYYPYKEFSKQSVYFNTFVIEGIQNMNNNYDTEIQVTPYWITLDGTRVEGTTVIRTINQGITTN